MNILIGLLTGVLFVTSLFLVLLILIQLPKKESGSGLAFGSGATDALFGAGSGNVLTHVTKYSAALFLGLCLTLSVMNSHVAKSKLTGIDQALEKAGDGYENPVLNPAPADDPDSAESPSLPSGDAAPSPAPAPVNGEPAPAPAPANP